MGPFLDLTGSQSIRVVDRISVSIMYEPPTSHKTPFYGVTDFRSQTSVLLSTPTSTLLPSLALTCGRLLELPLRCPLTTLPMLTLFLPYFLSSPSFFRHPSLPRALFGCVLLCLTVPPPPLLSHFPFSPWVSHFSWTHSRALACFRGHHAEKGKNNIITEAATQIPVY
jgi:hypothetical protein